MRVVVIICLLLAGRVFAQEPSAEGEVSTRTAKDFYNMRDFRIAYQEYEKLVQQNPENVDYNYKAGECILKGNFLLKGSAIPYLEKASQLEGAPEDVLLLLAKAYHLDYQFEKSIEISKKIIENSQFPELSKLAQRQVEMVQNALKFMENPLDVRIENLGPLINSEYPDYYAFVHENEEYLIYSTRRDKGNGGYIMKDGYKSADIFISKEKRGEWSKPRSIGGVLTSIYDEEIVGMSPDGEVVFINLDTYEISGQIQMAEKKGKQFKKPVLLDGGISTDDAVEISACITKDRQTIYFASNRLGGFGGYDLYKSNLLPNGTWGLAINLGPYVNSEYDEFFPSISEDGLELIFSSEGHKSMGGFYLFISRFDLVKRQWDAPKNFGFPVNSVDDDFFISFSKDKRIGYITSLRPGGIGNLDIYSVTFNSVEERQTVLVCSLFVEVNIDYKDYQEFNFYRVGNDTIRVIKEVKPREIDGWELIRSEKKIVKPGMSYRASVVMEKNGVEEKFSLERAPFDDKNYKLKSAKTSFVPIQGYKPPSKSRPKTHNILIKEAEIKLFKDGSDELVGMYKIQPSTERFIIITPPGRYKLLINAEGFHPLEVPIIVYGKGSYKSEISRQFKLSPVGEYPPIHYSKIEHN